MADGNYVRLRAGVAFPRKVGHKAGAACPHPKPRFMTGKERQACYVCRPKPEPSPRRPQRKINTRPAVCGKAGCGKQYEQWRPWERYCSIDCRSEVAAQRMRLLQEKARDRSKRACVGCGAVFAPDYGDRRNKYCSRSCRIAANYRRKVGNTHRRRARRFGVDYEWIDKWEIFERDGWRCQLCGVATPRKNSGKLIDAAPQLDHIVPVSKGGSHTALNVQCACRKCNLLKRDRPLGQLLLFG